MLGTLRDREIHGFSLLETIGEGTYGKVKLAHNPSTGESIAIKILCKKTLDSASQDDAVPVVPANDQSHVPKSTSIARLEKEITIHRALNHPNIIRLYESYEDRHYMFLLMELAAGGELFDKIVPDVGLDEQVAHFYFRQLVNGVSYLHKRGVTHRDLKPENMLVDAQGNLKISDFGLATVYRYKGNRRTLTTPCGSPPYLAPEVAQGSYDGERCDVWSMGIILYVLLQGCSLWDEPTGRSPEFVAFIASQCDGEPLPAAWDAVPPEPRKLILGMLQMPNKRTSLAQVAADPWVTQPNPLYNDEDGMCADVERLTNKLMHQLEEHGEEPYITDDHPMFRSISQPPQMSVPLVGALDVPVTAFSQPIMPAYYSQAAHLSQSQAPFNPTQSGTLLSSARLTRFYTDSPPHVLEPLLTSALSDLNAQSQSAVDRDLGTHGLFRPIATSATITVWLVLFQRRMGDPIEFKRFYKKVTAREDVQKVILAGSGAKRAARDLPVVKVPAPAKSELLLPLSMSQSTATSSSTAPEPSRFTPLSQPLAEAKAAAARANGLPLLKRAEEADLFEG
ncbi:CAMK/CAMKL/CHK1 protein kinase [Allomyces macrogynus ATCC 38327]|uniref:CAMK/CAMKL/CHK1 protein kinase n=1 Tax=Allomyces macrogynus (strain ATCC 38327) TaxID=578462 RepID=A0A0L0SBV4_ALLM3|nr:CAMK/CAMKL/CHK1 protein kinase [Allomyces macrogynus ATCC 38327]|eukprot:KNE59885.1 CAMK/CAMKL/CHK1 protein kinase [Allomyces macrogynus ATCC 38327]